MRRFDFRIEEELDAALGLEAKRQGVSKAGLIRRILRERLMPLPPMHEDPLWELVGMARDAEPVEDIDEFLYGWNAKP